MTELLKTYCTQCSKETVYRCVICIKNMCPDCFATTHKTHNRFAELNSHALVNVGQKQTRHALITRPFKFKTRIEKLNLIDECDRKNRSIYPIDLGSRDSRYFEALQPQQAPFSDSPLSTLTKGRTKRAYITHLVDPQEIYVHLQMFHKIVEELAREFQNMAQEPKPPLEAIVQGKLYLAWNAKDRMWQRCEVLSIDCTTPTKPIYKVFCIDFGYTKTVYIHELRLLPLVRRETPYPLAIRCSLTDCLPVRRTWTGDDIHFIREIIDNREVEIVVERREKSGAIEVNMITIDGRVDVAQALAFHERAYVPPTEHVRDSIRKQSIPRNSHNLMIGFKSVVYLTGIINPSKIYIRKKSLQPVFEKLCKDLEQENTTLGRNGKVFLPEDGKVYMVHALEHRVNIPGGAWVRAIVDKLLKGGRVRLFLPDCGIQFAVHSTALRHLDAKYTKLAALATNCSLAGMKPPNNYWSEDALKYLRSYQHHELIMQVYNQHMRYVSINLYYFIDENTIVWINKDMINNKLAVPYQRVIRTPVSEDPTIRETPPHSSYKGPLKLEVNVLHYESPSLLYVSLLRQRKAFQKLNDEIQEYCRLTMNTRDSSWQVGDRCCVLDTLLTYRRAVIMETLPGGVAKVMYTDMACVESVTMDRLRDLPNELATVGDSAIKCHLSGIYPPDDCEQWPEATKYFLKEFLDYEHQRVFITQQGRLENNSMPVVLWVYRNTPGTALEPDHWEWHSLNNNLVEQGMCLTMPDDIQNNPGEDDAMPDILDNVTNSLIDWQQVYINIQSQERKQNEQKEEEIDHMTYREIVSKIIGNEFVCKINFVYDYDVFELVFVHNDDEKVLYEEMQKELQLKAESMPLLDSITAFEECAAFCYTDNTWYRAAILKYNETANKVKVRFVDCGKLHDVSPADLREISMEFTDLPPGALLARLYGVQINPKMETSIITEECVSTFLENERLLRGKIIEYDDSMPQVELRYNDNGEFVYQDLLTKGVFIKREPQKQG